MSNIYYVFSVDPILGDDNPIVHGPYSYEEAEKKVAYFVKNGYYAYIGV